jgi:hypothetical protein
MSEVDRRQPAISMITYRHALVFRDRSPYILIRISSKLRSCPVQNFPVDHCRRISVRALACSALSLAVLSFATLSTPAQAQTYDPRYPVCMTLYQGPFGGEWIDCSYTSLPQCRASASGRGAMCGINPYFTTPPIVQPYAHHHRHRHAG